MRRTSLFQSGHPDNPPTLQYPLVIKYTENAFIGDNFTFIYYYHDQHHQQKPLTRQTRQIPNRKTRKKRKLTLRQKSHHRRRKNTHRPRDAGSRSVKIQFQPLPQSQSVGLHETHEHLPAELEKTAAQIQKPKMLVRPATERSNHLQKHLAANQNQQQQHPQRIEKKHRKPIRSPHRKVNYTLHDLLINFFISLLTEHS